MLQVCFALLIGVFLVESSCGGQGVWAKEVRELAKGSGAIATRVSLNCRVPRGAARGSFKLGGGAGDR